jgi:hypothetical protein
MTSSTVHIGSTRGSVSGSDIPPSVTPIYDTLCVELGDPELVAREADEAAIRWHAARLRRK